LPIDDARRNEIKLRIGVYLHKTQHHLHKALTLDQSVTSESWLSRYLLGKIGEKLKSPPRLVCVACN
jgi:hypothetical protein